MFWMNISVLLSFLVFSLDKVSCFGPAFAFTYTDGSQDADFFTTVSNEDYQAVYVYAGDVETYCHGVGGSSADQGCIWSGIDTNSWVYYTDYAKQTAAKYKSSNFLVYLNFDGRIGNGGYVCDFSLMSETEINGMANATAINVCNDDNINGMGWDVEPYNNNQNIFFEKLNSYLTKCNKYSKILSATSQF